MSNVMSGELHSEPCHGEHPVTKHYLQGDFYWSEQSAFGAQMYICQVANATRTGRGQFQIVITDKDYRKLVPIMV